MGRRTQPDVPTGQTCRGMRLRHHGSNQGRWENGKHEADPVSERPPSLTPGRRRLFATLAVAIGLVVPLLAAEVALRVLPVKVGLQAARVDAANPVFRFEPNRSFVWSRDWDLALVNRGRVNNAGFVNGQDYEAAAPGPLLAVIGDSYVEAAMVPYAETLHGRLAAALAGRGRVYSFGASGAALSQYLAWAAHARRVYGAAAMVFVVVGNDFDESLVTYKVGPGFHLYAETEGGGLRLERSDYRPKAWVRLLLRSALVRYAAYNLQVLEHLPPLVAEAVAAEGTEFLGNTSVLASRERLADSRRAVAAFFRDLPVMSGLTPRHILFVVDGLRYPSDDALTRATRADSYFARMRLHFMAEAARRGYRVVDMDELFFPHWRAHRQSFDYPARDSHWSPLGHALAAEAVMGAGLIETLLEPDGGG